MSSSSGDEPQFDIVVRGPGRAPLLCAQWQWPRWALRQLRAIPHRMRMSHVRTRLERDRHGLG